MRRVAEIIYVVPEEREAYMKEHLNPSERVAQILWIHGIRNQCFYAMNDLLLLCFDYDGKHFYEDMAAIAAYPEMKNYLVQTRRRDVPADQQLTTNWWAPLKRLGSTLVESPMPDDEDEGYTLEEQYRSMISGEMVRSVAATNDISFDEDDWSESIHI